MSSMPALQQRATSPERSRAPDLQMERRLNEASGEQSTFHATGIFIWEAFIALNDLDRHLWLSYIWCRRCRCSLASETGLSDQQVRARLNETATYLDEILHMRGLDGLPPLRYASAFSSSATGPSRRRLDAHMRRRESCTCKQKPARGVIQGTSASCA